jgi:hypothetical protein
MHDADDDTASSDCSRRTVLRRAALGGTALALGVPGGSSASPPPRDVADSTRSPLTPVETFSNPAPDGDGFFGSSVALSADGSTVLVSATELDGPHGVGRVYAFTRTDEGWTHTELQNPERRDGDAFGWAVALSADGTTALVGAPFDTAGSADDVGVAHLYTRTDDGWGHASLTNPAGSITLFGAAVALSADGRRALVTAPERTSFPGEAYLFTKTDEGWTGSDPVVLTNPDPVPALNSLEWGFGAAAALSADGTTAVVGQPDAHTDRPTSVGRAFAFTETDAGWSDAALPNPEPDAYDRFGRAVAVDADGTTAVVGARRVSGDTRVGEAYVFTRTAAEWTLAAVLPNPVPADSNLAGRETFGSTVSVTGGGTRALVAGPGVGDAYLYTQTDSGWTVDDPQLLSNPRAGDSAVTGREVAVSADGSTALVSAPRAAVGGSPAGAVYVFELDGAVFPEALTLRNGDVVAPVDLDGDGRFEDLNGDGTVDSRDVSLLSRLAHDVRNGAISLTDGQAAALDFDGDGRFTKRDLRAFARQYGGRQQSAGTGGDGTGRRDVHDGDRATRSAGRRE